MKLSILSRRVVACVQAATLALACQPVSAQSAAGAGASPFRFDRLGPIETPKPEAPLSLTASDGTGLKLSRLAARAVVEGPLAFTELQLAFENPENRVIEGQFRVVMPQGASVSRFAMKTDQGWQEGEVVDRGKARTAYEDFLHRRQDPALLEIAAANEFSARVFPIPANGTKELIISYSQELPRLGAPYVLPLAGLPAVGSLDAAVSSGGKVLAELKRTSFVPSKDFEAALPGSDPASGVRNKDLAVVRVQPLAVGKPEEVRSLLVLFDTSASRFLGFDSQMKLLRSLVSALAAGSGPSTPVSVASFDQTVRLVYEGGAGGFDDAAAARIRRERAMGASDLMGALRWAHGALQKRPAQRVLLITDGVATEGETGEEELRTEVKKLKAAGVERLDAVAVGGIRDDALLRRLVTAGLPKDGAVADGKRPVEEIGAKLTGATASGLEVSVEGAAWVWPKTIDGLQPKDDVFIFAELPEGKPFNLTVGHKPVPVPPGSIVTVERPLVERAWAKAKIESLLRKRELSDGAEAKDKVRGQIVDLSVKHRVVTQFTALLVLESLEDFQRYGIDRKALADILTVADNSVRVVHRPADSVTLVVPPAPDQPGVLEALTSSLMKSKSAADRGVSAVAGSVASMVGAAAQEEPSSGEPMGSLDGEGASFAPGAAADAMAFDSSGGGGGSLGMAGVMPMLAMPAPSPAPFPARAAEMADRLEVERARQDVSARERVGARAQAVRGSAGRPVESPAVAPPPPPPPQEGPKKGPPPYTGKFKEVMDLIHGGKAAEAAVKARSWLEENPGDVMAIVALGEALEAMGDLAGAARAYGSIIDLFPGRADLRRYAGERLERLSGGLDLAVDTYEKAVENRPDHPSSHRLFAFALLKKGLHRKAFEAMAKGIGGKYPEGRFRGVDRILREDLGLIAAAWIKAEPGRKTEILQKLKAAGGKAEDGPSVRFVLNWETDANDVDFHIFDGRGGHAFYSQPTLASGGELYADVTTGYGPECFTIRGPKARRAAPYTLQAHYYSRGPMGYGMGKLEIVEHDGNGGLSFEERPFVVMVDQAFLDLGKSGK